jgi:hypothetical protein
VQKLDCVFRRNGRVNVTRRGRQFSRQLAAGVCGSGGSICTVLERLCSAVLRACWIPTPFSCCPLISPPTRRRVPCNLNRTVCGWLSEGRAAGNIRYVAGIFRKKLLTVYRSSDLLPILKARLDVHSFCKNSGALDDSPPITSKTTRHEKSV